MLLTLDRKEMTALWLQYTRLEPLRADSVVTRAYGIDLEALAASEARLWYASLLSRAPLRWLRVSEMADDAKLSVNTEGITLISLPERCVRPVSVELHGWERPAPVVEPHSPEAWLQTNPYSRGGVARPVAVWQPQDHTLAIYSPPAPGQGRLKSLRGVADPGPDQFIFAEEALCTIPVLDGRPKIPPITLTPDPWN